MIKSSITYTKGNDWWLSRRDEDGRENYPDQIRVGSLEDPRVFVPERTCHIKLSKTSVWHCDVCGQTIDGNCFADNGGRLTEYRYCPSCGARVVDE